MAGWAQANVASVCPSQRFEQFLPAFSADIGLQSAFLKHHVRALHLVPTAAGVVPYQPLVDSRALKFPLMTAIAHPPVDSINLAADGLSATYTDKRAGLGNIKVYTFARERCWVLTGIEDWSVRDAQLKLPGTAGMSMAEQRCAARADVYGQLGGPERYPLTTEFFQAAEEYWVCAAGSGDPDASYSAASLSMSEMAPNLGYAATEKLYLAALKGHPDRVGMLAWYYCDGGDPAGADTCVAPAQARAVLEQGAATGNAQALGSLAEGLESGRLGPPDVPRALACYRAAVQAGNNEAKPPMDRLLAKGGIAGEPAGCL